MRNYLLLMTALGASLGAGTAQAQPCTPVELVQNYYLRYLGRPAEPCGLASWVGQLRCQGPEWVQAGILGSDEYLQLQGCSPEGFVVGLYNDVLGRTPCPQELHTWLCGLPGCGNRHAFALKFLCAARCELARRRHGPLAGPAASDPGYGSGALPYPGYGLRRGGWHGIDR